MQLEDPALEHHFRGHRGPITSLAFNPVQQQLASGSKDSTVMIWNFRRTAKAFRFYGHKEAVLDVCYSTSGHVLGSASQDRTVRLWTPTMQGNSTCFNTHTSAVQSIHFSPNGQYFVTASNDKSVKIWSVCHRSKFVSSVAGHGNWVRCARFSPDGRLVASCSDDRTTRLHDVRDNGTLGSTPVHTFAESRGYPQKIAFLPSGTCLAVAMALNPDSRGIVPGAIKVYDIRSHKLIQYYENIHGKANDVAFHPCGSYLASASEDSTIKIMDLLNGVTVYTLQGHSGAVTSVVFSHSGEHFATGGKDNQILVWKSKFNEVVDSLCSKVTLRYPTKKGMRHMEADPCATERDEDDESSHSDVASVHHHVDARHSVLNPVDPDVQITDVPSEPVASKKPEDLGFIKKAVEVDDNETDECGDREKTSGSRSRTVTDPKDCETDLHEGGGNRTLENSFNTRMIMSTLLDMNEQIETLRQTVAFLEQRLTIMEDQLHLKVSSLTS